MTMQEMATVMHHRLPIKLFILNNGGYLTIKQTQEQGFDSRLVGSNASSGISFPDLMKIASAHGIKGVRLSTHQNLKNEIAKVLAFDGPVVCEIMMDPDQIQAPKVMGRRNSEGKMSAAHLEDSYPFLDVQEIEENMRVANE